MPIPRSVLVLTLIVACNGDKDPASDSANPSNDDTSGVGVDDTGDTGVDPTEFDEGCHVVDGGYGFANLSDALTYASEGSTIELCEGTLNETVVLTKSVHLIGPGSGALVWEAPTNASAIEIDAATGVTLSGFSVISTRNGVTISGAANVVIDDVAFLSTGSTAVTAVGSADVTVQNSLFELSEYGAIEFDLSSGAVVDTTITAPVYFGINILESDVAIEGTTITTATQDGNGDGGFGIYAEGPGSLDLVDNVFTDNLFHVYSDGADFSASGDTVAGGAYAYIAIEAGTATFAGLEITDVYYNAISAVGEASSVSVTDTAISGDPELVEPDAYSSYLAGGLYIGTDADAYVSGVDVYGYNSLGALIGSNTGEVSPEVEIEDMIFDSPGRYGIYLSGVSGTVTDVDVLDMRLVDDPDDVVDGITGGTMYLDQWAAAMVINSDVDWTGGEISGSEHIGIFQFGGDVLYDDILLSDNEWAGLWSYQATTTLQNSTITQSSGTWRGTYISSGVYNYSSAQTITGNTFTENLRSTWYDYTDNPDDKTDDSYVLTESLKDSWDLYSGDATYLEVTNNTFTDGSQGMYIVDGTNITITDNTWQNYAGGYAVEFFDHDSGDVTFKDNTLIDVAGPAIYCGIRSNEMSNLDIQDNTITGMIPHESYLNYYDADGKIAGTYEYEYYSYGVYSYFCDLEIDGLTVTDAPDSTLYSYYGNIELYDVEIDGDGSDSLTAALVSWYPESVLAAGVSISDIANGSGMYIYNYEEYSTQLHDITVENTGGYGIYLAYGSHELSEITATGNASHGIYVSNSDDFNLSGATLSGNAQHGLYTLTTDGTVSDVTASSNTATGLYAYYSDGLTVTDIESSGNGDYGAYVYYADVDISGSLFSGNGIDGVRYTTYASGELLGNTSTKNGGYGVSCYTNVEMDVCLGNELSGNTSGENDGCAACGDGDTGGADTSEPSDTDSGLSGGDSGAP